MKTQTKIDLTLLYFVLWIGGYLLAYMYLNHDTKAFKYSTYALGFGLIPFICMMCSIQVSYFRDRIRNAIYGAVQAEDGFYGLRIADDLNNALSLTFAVGRDRQEQPQMAASAVPPQMPINPGIAFLNEYNRLSNSISNQRPRVTSSQRYSTYVSPSDQIETYKMMLDDSNRTNQDLRLELIKKDNKIIELADEILRLQHRAPNSIDGLDV